MSLKQLVRNFERWILLDVKGADKIFHIHALLYNPIPIMFITARLQENIFVRNFQHKVKRFQFLSYKL